MLEISHRQRARPFLLLPNNRKQLHRFGIGIDFPKMERCAGWRASRYRLHAARASRNSLSLERPSLVSLPRFGMQSARVPSAAAAALIERSKSNFGPRKHSQPQRTIKREKELSDIRQQRPTIRLFSLRRDDFKSSAGQEARKQCYCRTQRAYFRYAHRSPSGARLDDSLPMNLRRLLRVFFFGEPQPERCCSG